MRDHDAVLFGKVVHDDSRVVAVQPVAGAVEPLCRGNTVMARVEDKVWTALPRIADERNDLAPRFLEADVTDVEPLPQLGVVVQHSFEERAVGAEVGRPVGIARSVGKARRQQKENIHKRHRVCGCR